MEKATAPLAVHELQACRLTGMHLPKEINVSAKGFRLLGTVDMLKCHRNYCPGKHNAEISINRKIMTINARMIYGMLGEPN
jgi:hypothetical protein